MFEHPKIVSALVGSANATEAAFKHNEEFMLMLRAPQVPRGLQQYLAAVAAVATRLDQVAPYEARNLPAFFRGGDVYFRPTIVTSFRFDLRLPPAMRTAMARLREPIAGITARAGQTYDPFAKIGLTVAEEHEITKATAEDDGDTPNSSRVPLRNYGVQTCYGWWVPSAYQELLEKKLDPVRTKRVVLLDRLAHLLEHRRAVIRRLAVERFGQLGAYAKRERFALSESSEQRIKRFDALLERARTRLADSFGVDEPRSHMSAQRSRRSGTIPLRPRSSSIATSITWSSLRLPRNGPRSGGHSLSGLLRSMTSRRRKKSAMPSRPT